MKLWSLALSVLFWGAAVALILWVVRCPANQLAFSASVCAVVPLLALVIVKVSRGGIVISGERSETKPDAVALLIFPGLGLAIRALGPIHIISWLVALAWAGGLALVWICLAYWAGAFAATRRKIATFSTLLFIGLAYGYGAICLADIVPAQGTMKIEKVAVLRKYIGAGRGHQPYLDLSSSPLKPKGGDESVTLKTYNGVQPNQSICIVEHPGAIGITWYEVEPCEHISA